MHEELRNMLDVSEVEHVEVELSTGPDRLTLWINIDGVCRLRVCRFKNISFKNCKDGRDLCD